MQYSHPKVQLTLEADSYVFVLKENGNHQNVIQDVQEKYPTLKIDAIDEIDTITISSEDQSILEKANEYFKQNYQSIVEESSQEKRVTIKEFKLPTLPTLPIMNQVSKPKTFRTSSHEETRQIQGEESPNIYDPWRWDINKVTSNGESYSIQEGNHQVKIGIVDSGIDVNHPDLKENIIGPGKSLVPGVSYHGRPNWPWNDGSWNDRRQRKDQRGISKDWYCSIQGI